MAQQDFVSYSVCWKRRSTENRTQSLKQHTAHRIIPFPGKSSWIRVYRVRQKGCEDSRQRFSATVHYSSAAEHFSTSFSQPRKSLLADSVNLRASEFQNAECNEGGSPLRMRNDQSVVCCAYRRFRILCINWIYSARLEMVFGRRGLIIYHRTSLSLALSH